MKKLIIFYLWELVICFLFGIAIAFMKFYSGWFIFLLWIPISFGWLPFAEINKEIEANYDKAWGFISFAFLLLISILIACVFMLPDESFWAVTAGVGILCAGITTVLFLFKIRGVAISRN